MQALSRPKQNQYVRLVPLNLQRDHEALRNMAEDLGDQLEVWPFYHNGDWVADWIIWMQSALEAGRFIGFTVHTPDDAFAGLTGFLSPDLRNRSVEIGMTLYDKAYQGSGINPAAKLLLLQDAFAAGLARVQFNVDDRNARSKAAMRKLGAVEEGLIRDQRVLANGFVRSTAVFSILAREWPDVQAGLEARLKQSAS